jgi:hypothetical protein
MRKDESFNLCSLVIKLFYSINAQNNENECFSMSSSKYFSSQSYGFWYFSNSSLCSYRGGGDSIWRNMRVLSGRDQCITWLTNRTTA